MRLPLVLAIGLSLGACAEPPPEHQSEEAREARKADDLANAMHAPIDKARTTAEQAQEDYDSEQADTIDAAGNGDAPDAEPVDDSSGG
jgi:hypothetical protein